MVKKDFKNEFSLYDYREQGVDYVEDWSTVTITPKQGILAKCFECSVWDVTEGKNCTSKHCPLYGFNQMWFPSRVNPKLEISDEQREELSNRMRFLRQST